MRQGLKKKNHSAFHSNPLVSQWQPFVFGWCVAFSVSKGHAFSGVDKACACGDLTGHHSIAA